MILSSVHALDRIPKRIISLVPSQTELLHFLQLDAETIGITKFCIHPEEWYRSKSRIGGTKQVDIDKIKALQPDLIIANKEENVKEQVETLAQDFPVWVTDVNNLDDALKMIDDIGRLTHRQILATQLVNNIQHEFSKLRTIAHKYSPVRAAYLIWKDPYMAAGTANYINNMMHYAGLINIFSCYARYPEITISAIQKERCELVLLSSEPYPFKEQHIELLQKQLPDSNILLVDGEMFSWYGSRLLYVPEYFLSLNRIWQKKAR